jgi:hypothetical protein
MTAREISYVRRMVEARYYPEALYFGMLILRREATPELHLYLGIACLASASPVAETQLMLEGDECVGVGGLRVGLATLLPHEGFAHLLAAQRLSKEVTIERSLLPAVKDVLEGLTIYLRTELHGFTTAPYRVHRREAAKASLLLLSRWADLGNPTNFEPDEIKRLDKLIQRELAESAPDAEFAGGEPPLP